MKSHANLIQTSATAALLLLSSVSAVQGQWGGIRGWQGWGEGPGNRGSDESSLESSPSADSGVDAVSGAEYQEEFENGMRIRTIHGILASVAFIILFPLGSIAMRLVPGRFAIWVHAIIQMVSYVLYLAGAALGLYLVRQIRFGPEHGSMLSDPSINFHPIIGIVVLITLFLQPFLGLIHHQKFKKLRRRQVWSHMHLWNGRLTILLGIINGGLGLKIVDAASEVKIGYTVIAVVLGAVWLLLAIKSEINNARARGYTMGMRKAEAQERGDHSD